MRDGPAWSVPLVGGIWGLVLAKLVIEGVRRRHDAGRDAQGLAIVLTLLIVALAVGVGGALFVGYALPLYLAVAAFLALILFTLSAPGDPANNRWGPPPAAAFQSGDGDGTDVRGLVLAAASMLLGASSGYIGMHWVQGLEEARARMQSAAERPAAIDPGEGPPLENLEAAYERQQREVAK